MSFLFVLFYACRLSLHFLLFLIYFIFLVAHGIKPTSTCFQVLSSSPTQGGPGDRGGACLLAGGPLVCYTAVFIVVTQRSSPLTAAAVSGEERCVTTIKTAV